MTRAMQPNQQPTHYQTGTEEEWTLADYGRVIRRHLLLVVEVFLLAVLAASIINSLTTPVYQATVTLFIDQESGNVLTISDNTMALANQNYASYKEYFQSQKEIIRSRSVLEPVFEEMDLAHSPEYAPKPRSPETEPAAVRWLKKAGRLLLGADQPALRQDPFDKFMETISVSDVRNTRLLKLQVEHSDPQTAARIANRIAQVYVERNLAYISKNEILTLQKNEYLRLEAKLSELSKVYKSKHPQIIRLKQKMEDIVNKITQERDREFAGASADMTATELKGLKTNNVSVQEWAAPDYRPVRPDKIKNILLAAIFGLVAGITLAFFVESLDHSIKKPDDVLRLTGWHFLGGIPQMRSFSQRALKTLVHKKPRSTMAEKCRVIRTGLSFSSTPEHPVRSVLVTSPGEREGKSLTASNLAIVTAQTRKKVLLVEADMRKPCLHQAFKKGTRKGLSDYLSKGAALHEVVNETKIKNLSVIFAGRRPRDPSELLASDRMVTLLEEAGGRFDHIFLDAPPVMVVTDALILSKIVDGTVIVLESGKTLRRTVSVLDYELKNARCRLLGFVINKFKPRGGSVGRYGKYYSH